MKARVLELHERVLGWGRAKAATDEEEGRLLLEVQRAAVHEHLGMGFTEYVERFIGHDPRFTLERVRVAKELEDLPQIRIALRDGERNWSAVRELTRVARRKTEGAWLEKTKGMSVRSIEDMVRGHKPGDLPDDPVDEKAKKHVLRIEVSAETLATMREAVAKLKGDGLDEDAAYLSMARQALGGPEDVGQSSHQIAMVVCQKCEQGYQHGNGKLVPVAPEVVEAACCDANHISGKRAWQSVTPAVRKQVFARDGYHCRVPGCRFGQFLDVHHIVWQSVGGEHDLNNLLLLCSAHHNRHHRGELLIDRNPRGFVEFRHSDGSPYGSPRSFSDRQR